MKLNEKRSEEFLIESLNVINKVVEIRETGDWKAVAKAAGQEVARCMMYIEQLENDLRRAE